MQQRSHSQQRNVHGLALRLAPSTMAPVQDQGSAFRRKHLRFLLGRQLETMTAFKAAVGSTPGRVHPNVVRATPFFVGRGPSRRIGTVVNTYATSLRVVSDAENREIVSLMGRPGPLVRSSLPDGDRGRASTWRRSLSRRHMPLGTAFHFTTSSSTSTCSITSPQRAAPS